MIINFMKNDALDMLTSDIPNNASLYNSNEKWIDQYFEEKGFGSYYFSSGIMVPDVELTVGDSKTDFENAVKIFEAFKGQLNPVQASDLRLWSFLAHNTYWDYMRKRWAIDIASEEDEDDSGKDKIVSRIGSRYFFKASKGKAFVRQGIARLYWSAFLTYDEDNKENPYEMTEYFLSKQDIFTVSTERSLARYKTLLLAALKVLKEQGDLKRSQIRSYFLNLNQAGGVVVFDSLSQQDAYELAKKTMDELLLSENNEDADIIPVATDEVIGDDENINSEEEIVKEAEESQKSPIIKRVVRGSKVIIKNVKSNTRIPVVAGKSNFQTKPDLIGLKCGDTFKIRKDSWVIESIE